MACFPGRGWGRFEEKQSGMADRFKTFELVSSRFRPQASHYYLGALGVHPSMQGRGAGAALVDAYCEISSNDESATGTFLQTANLGNLAFYQRFGFKLLGEGKLDGQVTLWCLNRPKLTG